MQSHKAEGKTPSKMNTTESGVDFLLRMIPKVEGHSDGVYLALGELKYHDLIHFKAPSMSLQRAGLTYLIGELLVIFAKEKHNPCIFLMDLGYSLNMISVMKNIEERLVSKSLGMSSSTINKLLTTAPDRLKVASCATSTELSSVIASLNEIVIEERVSVVICSAYSLQEERKLMELTYNRLFDLSKCAPVIVIYCYTQLSDIPAPRYIRKPSANLLWSAEKLSLTLIRPATES